MIVFALVDLLFLGEVISWMLRVTSKNKRRLTGKELSGLQLSDEDTAYLQTIWVIERSWISRFGMWMTRRKSLGLGIARTVHFSREINTGIQKDVNWLYHELAHSLQYKYRGLVYIPEALIAQQFSGYDFGGKATLLSKKKLADFNPEQQAELFRVLMTDNHTCSIGQDIVRGNW